MGVDQRRELLQDAVDRREMSVVVHFFTRTGQKSGRR
jgi:hypothetical protein